MDFHCMKRKQLQALCKKHGVSANLSNREMADRLSLIFKKNKIVEKSIKKVSESGSKVVKKKVTFSPENETFIYEVSGYKRGGRRSSMRLPTKKQILPSGSRKRARRDDVEAKTDVEKRNVRGRDSKKAKNGVSEDNEECGNVAEFEETRKGNGRIGVGMKKRRGGSEVLAGDGGEQDKVRGNGESESEMLTRRKTRSQAKTASEGETEEPFKKRRVGRRTLAVETKDGGSEMSSVEPLKDVGRRKSVVPQKGKVEICNVEVEAVGKTSKGIDKVENVTGLSKRTRRSTVGELETRQTVDETRKRTRNSKTKLEAASRLEAIEESSKESDEVVNVSLPSGLSRRTRRNTIMFAASEGEVETHQPVRVEGHLRRSSRNASRSNSILTNSKTEGIASGVGRKGKQQKQRREQIIDEDISTSKCKPLAENPPRRSSRVASKSDLVKPTGPTNKVVGNKRLSRSRVPVIKESPCERFSASKEPLIEDVELAVGEAERATTNLVASYSKQVLESSNKFLPEPSNILAGEKAIEGEEPSNINHRSDNADDNLNKDDSTLVEEHQTLAHSENAEEAVDTVIQEALLEENLNERSSEKMFEVLQEKAEEISVTNASDEQGRSHAENSLEAVEMQEIAAESNLGIGESSGGNATETTPSRPALETEGCDNEMNNDLEHTLVANNVDPKEGAHNTDAQNVFQSTELEGGDTHSTGEEEFSGVGMDCGKFICICESSVSNTWDGDDVTTGNIQSEETFYKERTSVFGEKITEEDCNMNSLVGDSTVIGSVKRNDRDTKKNEKEVLELYAEDAVETENDVSEKSLNSFSGENRGRCVHEPLEAEEMDLTIPEERGTDVVKDTSIAHIDMQSPFTGDKGICPELALLENELINDEHETDIGTEKLFSFRARLLVHNDMQDKLKSKLNDDAMDVLIAGVQTEPLSQFALEKLQNSMKNDTQDASNSSCKVLCQPIGDCSSESRTEALDSGDLVGEKSSSVATREIDKEADFNLCADVAQEKNLGGALKVELDENVHNLETKDIDGKGFDGESDVEECADVVEEKTADCVLEVEFGDKNDLERMAPQVNDSTGASLREIIVKESEFSGDKGVKMMIAPGECIDRIDMLKMEESTLKNRNSDAVVMDVGASSPVIANHSVEMDGADVDDSSIQNGEIATDRETGTETVKKLLAEVDDGGTSACVSPIIPGNAFKDKFTEINAAASGDLSEIISAPCEVLEEKSVEVLGPGQHVDKVKFNNVKDSAEENVIELERNCFVTSDNNDTDTDRKANIEMIAGDSNFDFNRSDDVKEDTNAIPQVSTNYIDDHLLEVEFHNASDSDHNVMLDDAGEAFDFENVDGTKCVQKTPTFSQTIENRRKWCMKNSAKGKCHVDGSSDKPKMGSNTAAVSHSMVTPFLRVTENKSLELHDDLPHLTSPEVNMTLMVGKQVQVEKSAGGKLEANLITQDCKEAVVVKENLTNDEQVNQQVTEKWLGELEHQLHLTVSDEPLHITHDLVDVLEVKESITTNEQVNQQVTERQLGEQGSHQAHLLVSDEFLEMTQDREESLEVNENVTTDEHITKKQLVEQENQSYLAVSDEPNRDDEETNKQNGQSAINQECNENDFHKDSSYVSAEKVILKDATQTSGSNADDSDMFNVEHGSQDSRKADTIAVDSAVYSGSGSKGVAADKEVNIEGTKKMDMLEEVQTGGTWLPIMPVEQCTDQENPEEASPGIAGTVLQKIFSSSSGWEEKNISESRLFSEYKFPASSSVSYLCDLSFCNEIQMKDSDNSAGGEMVDNDTGKNHRDVALLLQEDKDSAVGKSETTESFSVENNRMDTQEVIRERLGEDEGNRKDANCPDNIYHRALNQSPPDNKSKSCVIEADGLSRIGDGVVTAGNSKEITDSDSFTGASSLVPGMVVDCSDVSPGFDFSNSECKSERKVEPDIFTAREINLLTGPGEQEEIENSDAEALETCSIRHNSGEENENVVTAEQVAPPITELVQLTKHKTTEEVAKFKSDFVKGSNEQELVLDMKHGTPDHKNSENQSLKLKRTDSAPSREAAAGDLWRWELEKKSPDMKSVKNFWYAEKKNSSMKMNSSVRKQSNRSSLIQTSPKQLVHDMKENVLGTKRNFSSATAHKPASKRRPLKDIRKD